MEEVQTGRTVELRVLDGPLRGARQVVDATEPVRVGGEIGCDIVLRGAEVDGASLSFCQRGGALRLRVLQGVVSLSGQVLAAGDEAVVTPGEPLRLGRVGIAIGPVDAAWPEAGADGLGRAFQAPATAALSPEAAVAQAQAQAFGEPDDLPAPVPPRPAPRWSRGLVLAGGCITVLSMSVLAFAYAALPGAPAPQQRVAVAEQALRAAGLPALSIRLGDRGQLLVSGYVDTAEQRRRAEQLIAKGPLPPRFDVAVNEQLVAAVRDIFRVNGIAADAEVSGPGRVAVQASVADAARLERVAATVRRDVPGLAALELRNAPPAEVDAMPVIDDPGKRVSSIVPGEPAYVVTADGTRYFEGAMLPTGHRIVAIREREVVLERGGTTTPLRF